ncbi:hypothetical protein MUK42_36063 [Musa troglodytarum]|uniref:Uncharacterized protein n=1 Tax=Musa troglodytarum TaxID=320322 RepID=A0A9E7KKF4_9LILI|nr:hypothetical protein MUK42_36063 [Musa troglodytarum]
MATADRVATIAAIVLQKAEGMGIRFIMNFNMNKLEVSLHELLNMLMEAESTIKNEKLVLYVGETKRKRKTRKTIKEGKGKGKRGKAKVLTRRRRSAKGKMDLKIGNEATVAAVAVDEVFIAKRTVFLEKEHILGKDMADFNLSITSDIEMDEKLDHILTRLGLAMKIC